MRTSYDDDEDDKVGIRYHKRIICLKIVELFIEKYWLVFVRILGETAGERSFITPPPSNYSFVFFTSRRLLSNGTYVAAYPLHDGKPTKDDNSGARCSRRVRISLFWNFGDFSPQNMGENLKNRLYMF